MNILFLTPYNPLDKGTGSAHRSMSLIRALRRIGDVYTVILSQNEVLENNEGIHFVRPFIINKSKHHVLNKIFKLLSFVSSKALNAIYVDGEEIRNRMGISGIDFDAVVVRYPWWAERTAAWKIAPQAPLYIDVDDNPADAYYAIHGISKSCIWDHIRKQIYVAWQFRICRLAHALWCSNHKDMQLFSHYANCSYFPNVTMVPNKSYMLFAPFKSRLLFVGCLDYFPNQEGMDWFISKIWPEVRKLHKELDLCVVGRGLPNNLYDRWIDVDGINILGFVDDLSGLYADSVGVVTPLFTGGGTAIKLIEAARYGCKIFSTSFAARGYTDSELTMLNIDLFSDSKSFCAALDKWMMKDDLSKVATRQLIKEYASRINTQEMVDDVVARTIQCS